MFVILLLKCEIYAPAYISDLLTSAADVSGRPALRTASRGDFIVPRTNRKFGDRAFCVAAPRPQTVAFDADIQAPS